MEVRLNYSLAGEVHHLNSTDFQRNLDYWQNGGDYIRLQDKDGLMRFCIPRRCGDTTSVILAHQNLDGSGSVKVIPGWIE